MLQNKKVCFIGAGAMAEAVIAGLLEKRIIKPGAISVTNRSDRFRLNELVYNFGVVADSERTRDCVAKADILVLATKPEDLPNALAEVKASTNASQLVISLVAGITTAQVSSILGHSAPIIRTMPNTSAAIGLSATAIAKGATATIEHVRVAESIFAAIGTVSVVDEAMLDAVTGLSGSGPAYVYYMAEALQAGAVKAGLDSELARSLVLQTLLGAAQMLMTTGQEPAELRKQVTSPNGTTQAGLDVLKAYGFSQAIEACVLRATERSRELRNALNRSNEDLDTEGSEGRRRPGLNPIETIRKIQVNQA